MDNRIIIFDTTLRDGEQSPGCSMNLKEKIEVARCLEALKVDVIEAGFAISSPGDYKSVQTIASTVKDCSVASLARASVKDIDTAWEAVKHASDPRIHLFLATSPLHMEYKLKKTPEQILEITAAMTAHAAKYTSNVEFSAEDATRSDWDFLVRVVDAAIRAGATTVNIPDTVGYTTPGEMQALIEYLRGKVPDSDRAVFSVHCHNDLGLATANSLAGVAGGARQIECTINGLGERSGNTALEEVVMAMRTRPGIWPYETRIDSTQIARSSRTVYTVIGQTAPLNKSIVGRNAFAHESGIHQHGVLANKQTYEILTPESVGVHTNSLILGKHSGKHAVADRLQKLGYQLSAEELQSVFEEFKDLCDKKKSVQDADLEAMAEHRFLRQTVETADGYELDWFSVHTSNFTTATCTVCLKKDGRKYEDVSLGDGPIDAAYNAIDKIVNPPEHTFGIWNIHSVSEGKDTLGDVTVRLYADGRTYTGKGLSTDVIEASINAYINAVNIFCAAVRSQEESA
ncbi:MAG: 2-isopropylmalate synthase [Oscillospiraceae bacterium]|nr:2-isopropylmalate synthase [Oscillospiraceae bacterium]